MTNKGDAGTLGAGAGLSQHKESFPEAGYSLRAQARDGFPGGQSLQSPPEQGSGLDFPEVGFSLCR